MDYSQPAMPDDRTMADLCEAFGAPESLARVALGNASADEFDQLLHAKNVAVDKYGASLCHYAALAGRVDWLDQCRAAGAPVWAPVVEATGGTLAHYAAAGGHVAVLDWLAEAMGVDFLRIARIDGSTIAISAAKYRHISALKHIRELLGPTSISAVIPGGFGVAHASCFGGSVDCVAFAIDELGPHTFRTGVDKLCRPPTFLAAKQGHVAVLEYLRGVLGNDCLAWTNAATGETLLHAAAGQRTPAVFDYVFHHVGSRLMDVTSNLGRTPAHEAAAHGHVRILERYVKQSSAGAASLEAPDNDGITPAHMAALGGSVDALAYILRHVEADALRVTTHDGCYATHLAASNGHVAMLRFLAETLGPDFARQAQPSDGRTPAHEAAANGHVAALRLLHDTVGAECLRGVDAGGEGPAHAAAANGHVGVLKLLLDLVGCSALQHVNVSDETVSDVAAINGHRNVLEWLNSPASGGCEDMARATAAAPDTICLAADYGHLAVVQFAFEVAGPAALTTACGDGFSVAQCAAMQGHPGIVDFVISSCGAKALEAVPGTPPVPDLLAHIGRVDLLIRVAPFLGESMVCRLGQQLTIAHHAATAGHVDVLRWIAQDLPGGANMMASKTKPTFVETAAAAGQVRVLEYVDTEFNRGYVRRCCDVLAAASKAPRTHLAFDAATGTDGNSHVAVLEYLESMCRTPTAMFDRRRGRRTVASAAAANGSMHALRFLGGAAEREAARPLSM